MNLRDLSYLVAVADLRSFVQAAKQCCISQPTLSTQIKKMEDALGIQVFERSNKKVLLTDVGEQIIASARRILTEVEQIKEIAAMAQAPFAGNFKLGALPTVSTYLFPDLVISIKQQFPDIHLILLEEKTEPLIQQLKSARLDAIILSLPIDDESLQVAELFCDELHLAVNAQHALAKKEQLQLCDLSQKQLLLLDEGHCLRDQALQFCHLNNAQEQRDLRATGLETLRQMVRAGTGITLIPNIAIDNSDPEICYLPFAAPAPKRKIALVWRKSCPRISFIEQLFLIIKNQYA